MSGEDWIAANQRVLVAEFARLRALIAGEDCAAELAALEAARNSLTRPAAIDVLGDVFGLSPFERDVLLLCAAFAMSDGFALVLGPRACATFGLGLKLPGAHWTALTPISPLRASRLIHVHDESAITTCRISAEERVLHYLAGVNYVDPSLRQVFREVLDHGPLTSQHQRSVESAIRSLESGSGALVQLVGDDQAAQREVARRIADHFGLKLRILSAGDIPSRREDSDWLVAT